ncbi:MAG: flagellar motor switch protein FliM, partial [Desulfatiglandales bacterium]
MPDQILTQEEIDALLGAIRKGEVSLEEEKAPKEGVKPYDLTSQSVSLRAQYGALEEVYDRFITGLKNSFYLFFQQDFEITIVSREIVKFSEILKGLSYPAYIDVFTMEPLFGSAILSIDPHLMFSLLDLMFGGKGKSVDKIRPFTPLELNTLRRVSEMVLGDFERAWEGITPIKVSHKKTEEKPEFLHVIDPSDFVISVVFFVDLKEVSGIFNLCLPYLMLEPIKEKLSYAYLRKREVEEGWNEELRKLVAQANVELIAELGRATLSIYRLMQLKENDIIRLNRGP